MGMALVTKSVVIYCQRRARCNTVFAIWYKQLYITNKTEYLVLQVGVPCGSLLGEMASHVYICKLVHPDPKTVYVLYGCRLYG